jgi:hypothetical protein
MCKFVRKKFAGGLGAQLQTFETNAVAVRKLLTKFGRHRKAKAWGEIDDALRVATEIERLAHFGQSCDAEDAVVIVGYVEVLTSQLARKIDDILAS